MNAPQFLALLVSMCSLVGAFVISVRWLVKHYLYELKPNSGSSMRDSIIRLEEKVEILYQMMLQRGEK